MYNELRSVLTAIRDIDPYTCILYLNAHSRCPYIHVCACVRALVSCVPICLIILRNIFPRIQ